jgi:hypothetical protein
MAGKIDMVITKSISRFARNTLDCLKYIRQLKEKNILVIFEKEGINSTDAKGEVMMTIMASLAQQESQSLSQNVRRNEKCIGDTLLQKTYTKDFLDKHRVKNNGIVPQYYIEDNHNAIIPREVFMKVQIVMRFLGESIGIIAASDRTSGAASAG